MNHDDHRIPLWLRFMLSCLVASVLGLGLASQASATPTIQVTTVSQTTYTAAAAASKISTVIAFAKAQVGKPYSVGGTGPGSYDCSGLTQASFAAAGISLPRTARAQSGAGQAVSYNDLQPGDLAFWNSPTDHIALYIGGGKVVSSPQLGEKVRIQNIWKAGFVNGVRIIQGGNIPDASAPTSAPKPAPKPAPHVDAPTVHIENAAQVTSSVYTVASGDTLSTIGPVKLHRKDLSWQDLHAANRDKVSNPNVIDVGLQLNVPAPGAAPHADAPVPAPRPAAPAPQPRSVVPATSGSSDTVWDKLAMCESGGNWAINTGNGFYGGLQFTPSTWKAFGGSGSAQNASRAQQISVAKRVLVAQGWGAWPMCTQQKLHYGAREKALALS